MRLTSCDIEKLLMESSHFRSLVVPLIVADMNTPPDHEKIIADKVRSFNPITRKIEAIKWLRQYAADNKLDQYRGLKEAKDKVEALFLPF